MAPMTARRRRPLVALPFLALTLLACGDDSGGEPAGSGTQVAIEGFAFDPVDVEVAPGTTITWTNRDRAPHTVEDSGGLFPESESLGQGDAFSFTYERPGEYPYICGIHPYMKGTVIVS